MEYISVPFIGAIHRHEGRNKVAQQLQLTINQMAEEGWVFVRVETIGGYVAATSGCFGLGAEPGYPISTAIVIFERNTENRIYAKPEKKHVEFSLRSESKTTKNVVQATYSATPEADTISQIAKTLAEVVHECKQLAIKAYNWAKENKKTTAIALSAMLLFYIVNKGGAYYNHHKDTQQETSTPQIEGVYPQSSQYALSEEELREMTPEALRIMRNEIFARKGFIFEKQDMQTYFSNQSWYRPQYRDYAHVANLLSDIEKENVEIIKRVEASKKYTDESQIVSKSQSAIIDEIKGRYETIVSANISEQSFLTPCQNGNVLLKTDQGVMKRIKIYKGTENRNYTDEYYFWNGELFFALTVDFSLQRQKEARFYIYQNQGVKCVLSEIRNGEVQKQEIQCEPNVIEALIRKGAQWVDMCSRQNFQAADCN